MKENVKKLVFKCLKESVKKMFFKCLKESVKNIAISASEKVWEEGRLLGV